MSPTTATSSATGSRASTAPPDFSWPAPHARAFREGPYRFFCCAHDLFHEPTHVHVERDTEEAKVWLDSASLDYNNGFSRLELRRIQRITTDVPVSSEPGRMPTPLRRASKCSCANGGSGDDTLTVYRKDGGSSLVAGQEASTEAVRGQLKLRPDTIYQGSLCESLNVGTVHSFEPYSAVHARSAVGLQRRYRRKMESVKESAHQTLSRWYEKLLTRRHLLRAPPSVRRPDPSFPCPAPRICRCHAGSVRS